jgi:hypothetical protein
MSPEQTEGGLKQARLREARAYLRVASSRDDERHARFCP